MTTDGQTSNSSLGKELSSVIEAALGLRRVAPADLDAIDRRADALWAATQDPFVHEAIQAVWDYGWEFLDWEDPAEQLPLRIDLCLLKWFGRVDSIELCRYRGEALRRMWETYGRISISDDMRSDLTVLRLIESDEALTAGYDPGDIDLVVRQCLREMHIVD